MSYHNHNRRKAIPQEVVRAARVAGMTGICKAYLN